MQEILNWALGYLGWGIWASAPVAAFFALKAAGIGLRESILAALALFLGLSGWQARGIFEGAKESSELRQALNARIEAEARADALAALVEENRFNIRNEVDDAINDIRRASDEASIDRGACLLSDAELDGLRRAFGYGTESGGGSPTGKSSR